MGNASGAVKAQWAVWVLVVWTVFLWLSRTRNVLANNELSSSGRAVRLAIVVVFVALALAVVVGRTRSWFGVAVGVLCAWTGGYWLVRGGGILLGDYTAGFKAVHTVLMAISIGLAALVWWKSRDRAGQGLAGAGLPAARR